MHVTAVDIFDMEAHQVEISISEIHSFRKISYETDAQKIYVGSRHLITDEWDQHSKHVLCLKQDTIIGSCRIVPCITGKLPFYSCVSQSFPLNEYDSELSRFLVSPDNKNGFAALALLAGCVEIFKRLAPSELQRGNIYADSLIDGSRRFGNRTLMNLGFHSTNKKYFDKDYGANSEIYAFNGTEIQIMYNHIENLKNRYKARAPIHPK